MTSDNLIELQAHRREELEEELKEILKGRPTSDNLIELQAHRKECREKRRVGGEQLKELLERERNELEDEFVADNIVMLVQRAQHDVLHGTGSVQMCEDTDLVADAVAEQMRGINGPGWKYSTDDVIELIDEESGVCTPEDRLKDYISKGIFPDD